MSSKRVPGSAEEACQSSEEFSLWTEELLGLEHAAEDEETTELLMSCTHSELQARGIAILKLAVSEQTTALYGRACLTLERLPAGQPLPPHRITHGDIVGLFDQGTRPLNKVVPLASAVVQRVRPTSISLAFDGDVPVEVLDGRQLHLATVSSEVTMKRYKEVLDSLKSGKSDGPSAGLLSVCFDSTQKPRFREAKSETCSRPDAVDCEFRARESSVLNEPQQAAVVKAMCAVDMAIIHGPPGTGKTTTLVAYILEAAYRKQRLLVTAPSNVAVDNLLERVLNCGFKSVVRLGHPARVQAELHRYTMDNVVYSSDQAALCRDIKKDIDDALKKGGKKGKDEAKRSYNEVNALRKELRQRERRAVAEVLRHTQVVFATCAGAATLHREIKKGGDAAAGSFEDFDVVIIDEAAQALEVACWIPMLLGPKAVLAGDHQQLAATVKSSEAQRRGLDRTLFARMIERHGDDVAALLSIQYRMNETIMGWSSRAFYSSRLVAAESVAHRTLDLHEVPSESLLGPTLEAMRAPLLFVDTGGLALYREDGAHEAQELVAGKRRNGAAVHQSRANVGEARFLVHYAKLLMKAGLAPKDLTVISPYNKQVELLLATFAEDSECQRLGIEKPRVNTVDSFQGQEADAVLLSLVRSNERGIVGFLSDYRRLNVAVTRARKHVMLVGDAATICSDKTLGSLYDYACESGNVVFVEQLLSEDGIVPPDPSVVQEPKRPPKLEKMMKDDKAKREQDAKREEKLRRQFDERLRPLLQSGGRVDFPSSLNPFERALAHEVATALGLLHESVGEGMQRRLSVWAPGHDGSISAEAAASTTTDGAGSPGGGPPQGKAVEGGAKGASAAAAARAADVEESDSDQETPLQAFERRAKATIEGLGSVGQPAAEWKAPSSVELEILERLVGEAGCELSVIGSGKKRRCRVETPVAPAEGATAAAAPAAEHGAAENKGSDSRSAGSPGSNSLLADLHASKVQRKADEAEERKKKNEAARAELKQGKKSGKQKVNVNNGGYPAEEEDFDALLSEVAAKDGMCAFGNCREKVNMMIDTLSLCRHCNSRFCLKHLQAECHGCGDAAKRADTKKWRDVCETASNPRGAGLVNKSVGSAGRSQLAGKLQEKISQSESSRSTKKKDKKK